MPQYEYRCGCGHIFERAVRIDSRMVPCLEPCPVCGNTTVSLQISAVATVSRVGGLKPKPEFTDVLKNIKKNVPHNKIDV